MDDVMRALWERHGRTGEGVPERGIETLACEVTGLDLGAFFHRALDTTGELDLATPLASVGLGLCLRPARGPRDLGGVLDPPADGLEDGRRRPDLGVRLAPRGAEAEIRHVLRGSPAEIAGLAPGDRVIAVDGLRADRDNLEQLVAGVPDGEAVTVHAFRRDELLTLRVRPRPAPADTCELVLLADPEGAARRRAWLGTQ